MVVDKTNAGFRTVNPTVKAKATPAAQRVKADQPESLSFHQLLDRVQSKQEVVFSAHARERIESRKIELGQEDLLRIGEAIDKVKAKGAKSSLLMFGEVALLASITNRTIITAVDGADDREQIFTGIDSAVILR